MKEMILTVVPNTHFLEESAKAQLLLTVTHARRHSFLHSSGSVSKPVVVIIVVKAQVFQEGSPGHRLHLKVTLLIKRHKQP